MNESALLVALYQRVQDAKFKRSEYVEITRDEYDRLEWLLSEKADPPTPDGEGVMWGFPAHIVDTLTA